MVTSIVLALALRVGGTFLWLCFSVIVARSLSVEDFGYVFYAINLIVTGGAIAALGYDVTMLRYGSIYWADHDKQRFKDLLAEGRLWISVSGIIISVIILCIHFWDIDVPVFDSWATSLVVAASIFITGRVTIERDALRAAGKLQAALFATSIIRSTFPLLLTIVSISFYGISSNIVLIFYFISMILCQVWDLLCLRRLTLPSVRSRRGHMSFAMGVWPGDVALMIFNRATGIILGATSGLEVAAIFIAAERIAQLGTFLTDAVRTAIAPGLARADVQSRQEVVNQTSALMLVSGVFGAIALPFIGVMVLWAFGDEYLSALPVLLILMVSQLSWTILGPTGIIMNMFGQEKIRSAISVLSSVVLILFLFGAESAQSAAVMLAGTSWLMNLCLWLYLRFRLGVTCGVFAVSRERFNETSAEFINVIKSAMGRIRR